MTKKAQDMIAKGIETGDMDMVKAGYDLLKKKDKSSASTTSKGVAKPAVLKKTVKKKAAPKKKAAAPKKRLTKPKPQPILTDDGDDDLDQFRMTLRSDESKRQREDGRRLARTEQVDLSKIGKSNSFRDDGEIAPILKGDKKLYRMKPVPRREASELVTVKCSVCDSKRPMSQKVVGKKAKYICDNCIKEKGRYKP